MLLQVNVIAMENNAKLENIVIWIMVAFVVLYQSPLALIKKEI
jgi:hypothetical protein